MKLPEMTPALSLAWLIAKALVFTVMALHSTEIIVIAYQRF